ncbi:phage tail sheath C-terminal domain-containing protein [Spongiivirga sp. MCCC 1A20706]|uniref:phage tail sheath family protein n=1 Tax=Spongiivirga sp. MCCC 1A20706 TaxID=3160963 RepID=UPI003977C9C9
MPKFKTPGVYIEETSTKIPAIAQVETAVPVFIGHTEKTTASLLLKPKRINSLVAYESFFGGPVNEAVTVDIKDSFDVDSKLVNRVLDAKFTNSQSNYFLFHCIKHYFDNGGGSCYIISIGDYQRDLIVGDSSSGFLGGLEVVKKEREPTLLLFPEAVNLELAEYTTIVKTALNQCADLNRFVLVDFKGDISNAKVVQDFRSHMVGDNLNYGAAYAPDLTTIFQCGYAEHTITINHFQDVAGTANPLPTGVENHSGSGTDLKNQQPALFIQAEKAIKQLKVVLPPSAAIAGIYTRIDSSEGVWKAPANTSVTSVMGLTAEISNALQEDLNVSLSGISINAIRSFVGRGILVWGARTMSSNDLDFRYINVRRFVSWVEESVKSFLEQLVFEPNDNNTWATVKAGLQNFLTLLYRDGALAGATMRDAFFVNIGLGVTMTQTDIDDGTMIVEIGMAVMHPAEFTIIRILQRME